MAAHPLNPIPLALRLAQCLTWTLLGYWGLVAVIFPVMIWDAHTYNLARIEIAQLGGLFGNPYWLGERQIAFPWTFDALHLPAIIAGWGYGLPSFACLLGVVLATDDLLTRHVNREAAIWAGLTLVGMSTLVYQGVSSKNDIPVLFSVACWAVALDHWRENHQRRWLALMATALAFGAGVKSSGLPFGFLLGLASLLMMQKRPAHALIFALLCIPALILLGSVETYINNQQVFGALLGPEWFVKSHSNGDGFRGFAANVIRYTLGNLNFGLEWFHPHPTSYNWLENSTARLLERLGLAGAGGRIGDDGFVFLKNGGEAGSDFGLAGTVAITAVGGSFFSLRWRTPAFVLSLMALLSLSLVALTTAWMQWNARFLLLPFCLGACVVGILATNTSVRPWARWIWLMVLGASALAAPFTSIHRNPRNILAAVTERDRVMTLERPAMLEIVQDLHARSEELHGGLLLFSGSDSWVFAIMHRMPFPVTPLPKLAPLASPASVAGTHLLILDRELPDNIRRQFVVIKQYTHSQSFLVRLGSMDSK